MKRIFTLLLLSMLVVIGLIACSQDDAATDENEDADVAESEEVADDQSLEVMNEFAPADVKDTDVCEVCAMHVANNEHATQIVLENKRSLMFDDIGCLFKWIADNGEDDIGAAYVRDFNSSEWILLDNSYFVFDESIQTPMAYGVISFENEADAQSYIDEHGVGTLMTASDLHEHEWKMNKEMKDHSHDHDDHSDDDEHSHDEHDDDTHEH